MFQYAFGRANAKRLNTDLKFELSDSTLTIHTGFELERVFEIQVNVTTQAEIQSILGWQKNPLIRKALKISGLNKIIKSKLIDEPHFHFSPEILQLPDNVFLSGYWQSEKYFLEIEAQIRSDFSFKLPFSDRNSETAREISKSNSVSLHVRRNDFAKNSKINAIHGLCTLAYYSAAIQFIEEKIASPNFFVFSDDPAWVKSNLKINHPCVYVEHNQGLESYNDMRLMSLCRHNIIANSSFSWWGAWLNSNAEKIVVAPQRWFVNGNNTEDLIPHTWVRL